MNRPFSKSSAASASTASLLPTTNPRQFSDPKTYSVDSHSSTSHPPSLSEKYALSPSPASWGAPLDMSYTEPDDFLHNPDPKRDRINDRGGTIFTARGLANVGCLVVLALGIITLFAGYPIISLFTDPKQTTQGGFNLGGINATGQIPILPGNFGLIDKDTPKEAYTKKSYLLDEEFVLVFSDEFEQEGRTFWPGDDPYWEAVNLHYWATTGNGSLLLRMDRMTDPSINHDMEFRSGMVQSWNKFCFTGGLIEVMVRLPGSSTISGLWPGAWTMGNLGRAGYGASVEGLWPYSYDECDVGTLPNQTYPGTRTPIAAHENGDPSHGNTLSYLPGQRLSACTCPGEPHPGPARADGTYVGRAAPEIDILEAIVENGEGHVSLSAQWAPYNAQYLPNNSSGNIVVDDPLTVINPYKGGVFQQTTSGLAATNQSCYELSGGCFTTFGFEYRPGFDDAYITWYNNNRRSWTLYAPAMQRDPATEISARPVPVEPMYIILNLAISLNFGFVDFENLEFPATMSVDYVRVYQPKNAINTGCDPKEYPTAAYIETFKEAYTNNNLTIWSDYKQPWPKNRLMPGGCD